MASEDSDCVIVEVQKSNGSPGPPFVPERREETKKLLRFANERLFGFKTFRFPQEDAMTMALEGKDVLLVMPTGGGKSLCYQLPACLTPGVSIVISPLLSLMQDQVSSLVHRYDIPATYLSGDQGKRRTDSVFRELRKEEGPSCKLLYTTPEKLARASEGDSEMWNVLKSLWERGLLSRIVVDEAHCICSWGHDFRRDFRLLGSVRLAFPDVPIMALTATASPEMCDDICTSLRLRSPEVFRTSFNRPNLVFSVRKKARDAMEQLGHLVSGPFRGQCGIVYCMTRAEAENVAVSLRFKYGVRADAYHAGMASKERNVVQDLWSQGAIHVVCATIAYGMGIDKADVRFVIHFSVAKSIEGYSQEAGRAGRDGKTAHCIVLFSGKDIGRLKRLVRMPQPGNTAASQARARDRIDAFRSFCEAKSSCRRYALVSHFGETSFNPERSCRGTCENCARRTLLHIPDRRADADNDDKVVAFAASQLRLVHGDEIAPKATSTTSTSARPIFKAPPPQNNSHPSVIVPLQARPPPPPPSSLSSSLPKKHSQASTASIRPVSLSSNTSQRSITSFLQKQPTAAELAADMAPPPRPAGSKRGRNLLSIGQQKQQIANRQKIARRQALLDSSSDDESN